jgi:hypothetical protein
LHHLTASRSGFIEGAGNDRCNPFRIVYGHARDDAPPQAVTYLDCFPFPLDIIQHRTQKAGLLRKPDSFVRKRLIAIPTRTVRRDHAESAF